jgi:serine/threonine protein kinase/tetratricopeptide (TPR) repeat protein
MTDHDTRDHDRVANLFLEARKLEPGARQKLLDEACEDDSQLRADVESLLVHDQTTTQPADSLSRPTEKIGDYRTLQRIGEGGMGEVYLAEQEKPVRRRVALKIIKRGMETDQVIARFEAERQALAMMNHPNVAKVFDAGATEQGRPYFAMEYVEGVPITEFCDRHRLTTKERLDLFMQVCEGVQHAHQNAIIHRDIKPSNVLVSTQDGKRITKIIDFGVAKATTQRLTERTIYTELGQLIGTPEYMSPEQAEMTSESVDTRTDVYSLGVLLYELLVGALPFDPRELRRAGFDEIRRKIREEEPSKPSTRLSTLGEVATGSARNRRTDPTSLARQLRGDLDWITMKALEKDRTRRYGSPNEFAADINRHLKDEPVLAGPPSTAYRMGKFVRRHRVGVTIAVAAFLLLLGFAARERIQANRIAQERDRANLVSEFQADMLGEVDPERLGKTLRADLRERVAEGQRRRGATDDDVDAALASFEEVMRVVNPTDAALRVIDEDILDRAGKTIEERFSDQPLIAARLRHTIGNTYRRLGLWDRAEPHARLAVEIRQDVLGEEHPDTLNSMNNLANLYWSQNRYDEAEPLHLETLETQRRVLGDDHPDTLNSMNNLANLYWSQDRYDEAEPLHLETLEARRRLLGEDHPDTLNSMNNLAILYMYQGRYDEAEPLYLEVLETERRVLGEDHPNTLATLNNLAVMYAQQGRYDEAEPFFLENLEVRRRVLGTNHPDTLQSLYNLACAWALQGQRDKALDFLRQAVEQGFAWRGMIEDSALKSLHGDPEFEAIVGEVKKRVDAE